MNRLIYYASRKTRKIQADQAQAAERDGFIAPTPAVEGKPNYLNILLPTGETIRAYNENLPSAPYLPVKLSWQEGQWVARQRKVYPADAAYVMLKNHWQNHTWDGPDTVPIHQRQILSLAVIVTSGLNIQILPGWIETDTGFVYYSDDQEYDLSSYKPASGARYLLIYFDTNANLTFLPGSTKPPLSLSHADIPAKPAGSTALAAIRLLAGSTLINDINSLNTDLLDLRGFGSSGGGAGWAEWGEITGTLADQTDLQAALDVKAATADLAPLAFTGDWADINNKPSLLTDDLSSQVDGVVQVFTLSTADGVEYALYWNGLRQDVGDFSVLGDQLTTSFTPLLTDSLVAEILIGISPYIQTADAPADSALYARKDSAWQEISPYFAMLRRSYL